jgi:hypothetical protein
MNNAGISWPHLGRSNVTGNNVAHTRQITPAVKLGPFQAHRMSFKEPGLVALQRNATPEIRRSILRKLEVRMAQLSKLNGELSVTRK